MARFRFLVYYPELYHASICSCGHGIAAQEENDNSEDCLGSIAGFRDRVYRHRNSTLPLRGNRMELIPVNDWGSGADVYGSAACHRQ